MPSTVELRDDYDADAAELRDLAKRAGGTVTALMLPKDNTHAMEMHLDEISRNVAAKAHAVVLMNRAGWHKTDKL